MLLQTSEDGWRTKGEGEAAAMGVRKQPCQETKELWIGFTAPGEGLSLGVHTMATSVATVHKISSSPSWTARQPIHHTSFLPYSFTLAQAKLSHPWEVQ